MLNKKLVDKNEVKKEDFKTCLDYHRGPIKKFLIEDWTKEDIINEIYYRIKEEDDLGIDFYQYFILTNIMNIMSKYSVEKYGTLTFDEFLKMLKEEKYFHQLYINIESSYI
jgi:hypothetical protein